MTKIFVFSFLILTILKISYCSDVVVLTPENFDQIVDGSSPVLIDFYAPWCGFCKKLDPEWDDLAKRVKEGGDKVIIAKIDASEHSSFASRYPVSGFPTLIYFPNGPKSNQPYEGDRDLDSFIEFLNENADTRVFIFHSSHIYKKI